MVVTAIKLQFKLTDIYSLKEKRNIISSIKNKLQNRFKTSVIEADYHDSYTMSLLGLSFASINKKEAEKKVQMINNFLEDNVSGIFEDMEYFIEIF